VADFVHLSQSGDLTLVPVKAAATASLGRGISVDAYQEVVSQTTKNLLYVDTERLLERLRRPRVARAACWLDGRRTSGRQGMLDALDGRNKVVPAKVLVVQPHVTHSAYVKARGGRLDRRMAAAPAGDTVQRRSGHSNRPGLRPDRRGCRLAGARSPPRSGAEPTRDTPDRRPARHGSRPCEVADPSGLTVPPTAVASATSLDAAGEGALAAAVPPGGPAGCGGGTGPRASPARRTTWNGSITAAAWGSS
jgi:hypothetical protein